MPVSLFASITETTAVFSFKRRRRCVEIQATVFVHVEPCHAVTLRSELFAQFADGFVLDPRGHDMIFFGSRSSRAAEDRPVVALGPARREHDLVRHSRPEQIRQHSRRALATALARLAGQTHVPTTDFHNDAVKIRASLHQIPPGASGVVALLSK